MGLVMVGLGKAGTGWHGLALGPVHWSDLCAILRPLCPCVPTTPHGGIAVDGGRLRDDLTVGERYAEGNIDHCVFRRRLFFGLFLVHQRCLLFLLLFEVMCL